MYEISLAHRIIAIQNVRELICLEKWRKFIDHRHNRSFWINGCVLRLSYSLAGPPLGTSKREDGSSTVSLVTNFQHSSHVLFTSNQVLKAAFVSSKPAGKTIMVKQNTSEISAATRFPWTNLPHDAYATSLILARTELHPVNIEGYSTAVPSKFYHWLTKRSTRQPDDQRVRHDGGHR